MENLFAYGTLMCQDIMQQVAGCYPPSYQGVLAGYSRRPVKGEIYPALVPDEKGAVEGILYRDVPPKAWQRLDRFEGEMYSLRSVEVTLPGGTVVPAEVYVIRPEFAHVLEEEKWDFENFLRQDKERFQREL